MAHRLDPRLSIEPSGITRLAHARSGLGAHVHMKRSAKLIERNGNDK